MPGTGASLGELWNAGSAKKKPADRVGPSVRVISVAQVQRAGTSIPSLLLYYLSALVEANFVR